MQKLELVVVASYFVHFRENLCSLLLAVRKNEFQTQRTSNTLPNGRKEELDPSHQAVKEPFSLGMHFVHKLVEGLFMPSDQVDKGLDGSRRVELG